MLQCQSYALFSFAFVSNGFFKILSLCILGLFKKSFQIDIKQESQLNCIENKLTLFLHGNTF